MKKMKKTWIFLGFILLINVSTISGQSAFECPYGWEDFDDHCYRFHRDPTHRHDEAKIECAIDGADLLSITNDLEHNFIVQTLESVDGGQVRQNWWTSGKRIDETLDFYWEGDGSQIESYKYWHNTSIPEDMSKDIIMYHFDSVRWAWITGTGNEYHPLICEISKDDIYKISQGDRGPDYGVDGSDPETVPRGPKFTVQPVDTVYESSTVNTYAVLNCEADAYPPPVYNWYKEDSEIDPESNEKYTLVNGQLIIDDPNEEDGDDGRYQCAASNDFGTVLSNTVELKFGFLQDFPKDNRAPVDAVEFNWISIECNPPPHFPDVVYTWFKDGIVVQSRYKPYTMTSYDGRLYFSEVTKDDMGHYQCSVQIPGRAASKHSMPIELKVGAGSPGIYEPKIGSGFPVIHPKSPKVGDSIRIECWATGTAAPGEKLYYYWNKVLEENNQVRVIDLPPQSYTLDHDRVLVIPNVQVYDAGMYRCMAQRENGQSNNKTVPLRLDSYPYFILPLKDQFADVNTPLKWRCTAGGTPNPSYFWARDGVELTNDTIAPEDRDRVFVNNNVLDFLYLDPKDNGMYQCSARNTHGTRYSTAELRVLSFPPNFAKYPLPDNQFATEEGNTTLLCRPEAAPFPEYDKIMWRKDGVVVGTGDPDSGARIIKLQNGNLFISPVQSGDAGRYQCLVENSLGTADTLGNLTVLSTTTISQPPLDDNIEVNRTAFLHCIASYNPKLDVTYVWYHRDYLIEFEKVFRLGENRYEVWYHPHFKRGSGLYVGGLYIMRAQYEHAGLYTCQIESASGGMSATAQVYINGPPSEPAGVAVDGMTVTRSSVMLQWKVGGTNGKDITSFVIEGINEFEGFWKVVETNVRATPDGTEMYYHNVTGLRPHCTYELRVRAENELGTSEASLPSGTFVTGGMLPDYAPEDVGGGGGKVGDLVITWTPLHPWEYNAPGLGYRVHWKNAGDDEWDGMEDVSSEESRFVTTVGENNFYREYDVAVLAFNDVGDGPISDTVRIRSAMALPPATAQDVRVQPWNSTSCLVHWEPVSDTRESIKGKLGGYRISYWRECCETEEMAPRLTINGQAEEALVIGLYPNTPYYFDVMVWNMAGNGPKSQFFIQRTLRSSPIEPPVEVKLEKISSTAIFVKFRGVSTTSREEPLEGYAVRIWPSGSHIKVATDYDCKKNTELYIDDLNPDEQYKLRVFGYSRGGQGTMSSPSIYFQTGGAPVLYLSSLLLCLCMFITKLL